MASPMRCRVIIISNMSYNHFSAELADSGVAGALEEDVRRLDPAFRQRLGLECASDVRLLLDLKRGDERLENLVSGEKEPFIQDGDLVVVWVAGYGMSFPGRGGAVLLPVDAGSEEEPLVPALADDCGITTKILRPVRNVNPTGVIHLVCNLFCLRGHCSPMLDPSCISEANIHILASFAPSPQLLLGKSDGAAMEETATSTLCRHYCRALLSGITSLEDVCGETIRGVLEDSAEKLTPIVMHSLSKPSSVPAADGVASFVWRSTGPVEFQPCSSASPAALLSATSAGGLTFNGHNPLGVPPTVAPVDDFTLYEHRRGPAEMCVAAIQVESQNDKEVLQMREDEAMGEAMRHFIERSGFIAVAMGPDSVEIYRSHSRSQFEKMSADASHWDTYVRQPGLQRPFWPSTRRMAPAAWGSSDVHPYKAVRSSAKPSATLTFDPCHPGLIGFGDDAFLAALRLLCDRKSFAAASVRVEEAPKPVEVNPTRANRKCSSVPGASTRGELHASAYWQPQGMGEHWLLMDLGKARLVRGLVIQGHHDNDVTEVAVECGREEDDLHPICDARGNAARMGLTWQTHAAGERLPVDFPLGPVIARYIKVWPKTCGDIVLQVGVRVLKGGSTVVRLYRGASRQQILERCVEDTKSTLYLL